MKTTDSGESCLRFFVLFPSKPLRQRMFYVGIATFTSFMSFQTVEMHRFRDIESDQRHPGGLLIANHWTPCIVTLWNSFWQGRCKIFTPLTDWKEHFLLSKLPLLSHRYRDHDVQQSVFYFSPMKTTDSGEKLFFFRRNLYASACFMWG